MKWKICGMKDKSNILTIAQYRPDFMGFIFYEPSPRNCFGLKFDLELKETLKNIKKVGVFVEDNISLIEQYAKLFQLDYIQTYTEDKRFLRQIKAAELGVIKVFRVNEVINADEFKEYQDCVDYYLFDTFTENYGGVGKRFDWGILNEIEVTHPYFLAGGVDLDVFEKLNEIKNKPAVLDINSRFEMDIGIKDEKKIEKFMSKMLNYNA